MIGDGVEEGKVTITQDELAAEIARLEMDLLGALKQNTHLKAMLQEQSVFHAAELQALKVQLGGEKETLNGNHRSDAPLKGYEPSEVRQ